MSPAGRLRRIGIAARRIRLRLGIGRPFHHALIGVLAVSFEMLVPAFCEERVQFRRRRARRVDIAIGDRSLDAGGRCRLRTITELNVHGVASLFSLGMIFSENRIPLLDHARAGCFRRL
jgi:hypothetical protein